MQLTDLCDKHLQSTEYGPGAVWVSAGIRKNRRAPVLAPELTVKPGRE